MQSSSPTLFLLLLRLSLAISSGLPRQDRGKREGERERGREREEREREREKGKSRLWQKCVLRLLLVFARNANEPEKKEKKENHGEIKWEKEIKWNPFVSLSYFHLEVGISHPEERRRPRRSRVRDWGERAGTQRRCVFLYVWEEKKFLKDTERKSSIFESSSLSFVWGEAWNMRITIEQTTDDAVVKFHGSKQGRICERSRLYGSNIWPQQCFTVVITPAFMRSGMKKAKMGFITPKATAKIFVFRVDPPLCLFRGTK